MRFTFADSDAQAVRVATTQARAQAEAVAAASGMQLGHVLLLTTLRDYPDRSAISIDGASFEVASGRSGTVVMRPSIPISVTVYGRWELIPKP